MKKSYRFNFIPGVEFINAVNTAFGNLNNTLATNTDDEHYHATSVDPDCASTVKATINGLLEYERVIDELKTKLKKKDETIEKLRNTAEFANRICDGYGALTDTLMSRIEEKNSEIKVLSDQVTRFMDQLKEVTEGNSGCKSCLNGPEPCCDICGNTDCEHRAETEGKSETNLDKVLHGMFISALDTWLNEDTDMPHKALTEWLEENTKED